MWISTTWTGGDDYSTSDATIQFADDEPIAEPSDLEIFRASLCDGWHAMADGDPALALPLIDEALEGLSDVGLPWLLRSMGRLMVEDVEGAAEDIAIAIELDPSLLSVRWNEQRILGDSAPSIRGLLWSKLEQDPADVSAALMIGVLSLLSSEVADAPARGALSELLLEGHGNQTTIALYSALRGENVQEPSEAALWLTDPDCSRLLEVMP